MKKNIIFKVFAVILSILMVAASGLIVVQLYKMDILPQNLFIPVVLLFILLCLIFILWINIMAKGIVSKVLAVIFVLLYTVSMGIGNLYLYKTDGFMQKVTDHKVGEVKNTVSIIVKDESKITKLSSLRVKRLADLTMSIRLERVNY